jgi:hypothetical protein
MSRAKTVIDSLPTKVGKLVKAAGAISTAPAERPDFLHAVMCQAALPRSRQEGLSFERKVGSLAMRCDAGKAWTGTAWEQQPLPFGVRPRLALIHICSEAVRKQSKEIEVGSSVRDFLLQLGMDTGGRGYSQFQGQMAALAACRLQFGMIAPDNGRVINVDAKPISKFDAWLNKDDEQQALWPGKLTLTGEFFDSLLRQAVPLDHRALAALASSALSLDLYTWLAYRLCNVRRATGERVSWAALEQQFGGEYGNRKDFKREFVKRLVEVQAVYPEARIEPVDGGIKLLPSPPPVRRTTVAVKALTTGDKATG